MHRVPTSQGKQRKWYKNKLSGTQEFGNFAKTGNFLIPDICREISLFFLRTQSVCKVSFACETS